MPQFTVKKEDFPLFYERYKTTVFGICRRYYGDAMRSEELYQEVFLKVYTRMPLFFESREHEKAYVIRTSINICISHKRKPGVEATSLEEEEGETFTGNPEVKMEKQGMIEAIDRFIRSQDDDETQSMLWLLLYNDYSLRKLADIYGYKYWKLYRKIHKLLQELQRFLRKNGLEELDEVLELA